MLSAVLRPSGADGAKAVAEPIVAMRREIESFMVVDDDVIFFRC
jgi:hypothetical protein